MPCNPRHAIAGLIGVLALSACGGVAPPAAPSTPAPATQVTATFAASEGVATTYDQALVPVGAKATVSATSSGGKTTVRLTVSGLQPGRGYGAHAHAKSCGAKGEDAGPHYQYETDPVTPSVDPKFANPQNEIWLDLTTDGSGAGTAESTVAWEFRADRRAQSVIIHAMPTITEAGKAGTAGARAACVKVDF